MRLEPLRHLRDLDVGQPAVRLPDHRKVVVILSLPVVTPSLTVVIPSLTVVILSLSKDGERVVGEHVDALAVAAFDRNDDAVERRELALEFQPRLAAPSRRVRCVRSLEDEPFVAASA